MVVFSIFQKVLFCTSHSSTNFALKGNRVVFIIKQFNVFLSKQKGFWSFHVFLMK